ncbi:MAG: RNA polymerase sigma factor [Cellulosilyticaceae bacterium]
MDEQIEKMLIEQAQKGSVEAFEKLIIHHEKTIYAICLRMLCHEQEAYDAAQEVCVKIWRQIKHFEGNAKFTTWLYRIATNQCLDMLRKQKRKDEVSLYQENKEKGEVHLLEQEDTKASVEEHMERLAMQDVMSLALGELKEEYREILVLRDMEGYAYEEIARVLELNNGTVKSRLSRARMALKKILMQNKEPYVSYFRQITKKEGNL